MPLRHARFKAKANISLGASLLKCNFGHLPRRRINVVRNSCYYSWARNIIFLLFCNHPSEAIGQYNACYLIYISFASHLHLIYISRNNCYWCSADTLKGFGNEQRLMGSRYIYIARAETPGHLGRSALHYPTCSLSCLILHDIEDWTICYRLVNRLFCIGSSLNLGEPAGCSAVCPSSTSTFPCLPRVFGHSSRVVLYWFSGFSYLAVLHQSVSLGWLLVVSASLTGKRVLISNDTLRMFLCSVVRMYWVWGGGRGGEPSLKRAHRKMGHLGGFFSFLPLKIGVGHEFFWQPYGGWVTQEGSSSYLILPIPTPFPPSPE